MLWSISQLVMSQREGRKTRFQKRWRLNVDSNVGSGVQVLALNGSATPANGLGENTNRPLIQGLGAMTHRNQMSIRSIAVVDESLALVSYMRRQMNEHVE